MPEKDFVAMVPEESDSPLPFVPLRNPRKRWRVSNLCIRFENISIQKLLLKFKMADSQKYFSLHLDLMVMDLKITKLQFCYDGLDIFV